MDSQENIKNTPEKNKIFLDSKGYAMLVSSITMVSTLIVIAWQQ